MTEAEKAYQYFVIAVPENEEQAKAYFWARKALQSTLTQPNPEEVKQMRWIPVEERKPKPSDNPILIYKSWDGRANFIGTAWYSSFHGWIPTNGTKIYGVTHWMPLPPPPT